MNKRNMTLFSPQIKFDLNKINNLTIGIIVLMFIINEKEIFFSRNTSKSPWIIVDDIPSHMENRPESPKPCKFYLFTSTFFGG